MIHDIVDEFTRKQVDKETRSLPPTPPKEGSPTSLRLSTRKLVNS